MKKRILSSTILATTIMFSGCSEALMQQETNETTQTVKTPIQIPQSDKHIYNFDKIKDDSVKELLFSMEATMPNVSQIIKDYFAAQSCDDEFYIRKSKDELSTSIKEYATTPKFGTLIGYYYAFDDHKAYNNIINNYKYMNCGIGKFSPDIMKDESVSDFETPKNQAIDNTKKITK